MIFYKNQWETQFLFGKKNNKLENSIEVNEKKKFHIKLIIRSIYSTNFDCVLCSSKELLFICSENKSNSHDAKQNGGRTASERTENLCARWQNHEYTRFNQYEQESSSREQKHFFSPFRIFSSVTDEADFFFSLSL